MPLTSQKLGPYLILAPLGRGGMGEVWRAHDPRLGRDVAIKVSDQQFSDRFEREARAIAALNHPNICTLYDVGPNYLVMELVEGLTLAERIGKGPVPLDEALVIAGQIAEALDAAHEKGIIHRDLKPANIKIRPDNSIKVLDFGLAKSVIDPATGSPDSPTTSLSSVGTILGTAGYMSPEQARGREVDKRSDIWAFGVVLYEMTTGKRLFDGATVSDRIAAILRDIPDLTAAPPQIHGLLTSCLERDPGKRLRDIGDWQQLLGSAPRPVLQPKSRATVPWVIAAAAILAAIALASFAWSRLSPQQQMLRLTLQIPEKTRITGSAAILAISPDGRHVALNAEIDGKSGIWLRDLDGPGIHLLPGTEGADSWFWSPDSRWIAFFAADKLKKIDVMGGPPQILCDANGVGGAWSPNGSIIFVRYASGLSLIPDTGGTPVTLTRPDPTEFEVVHRAPWFLPDGRHFLYTARSIDHSMTRVYVDSIEARPGSVTRRLVLAVHSNVAYVPRIGGFWGSANQGYLLFGRENTLMAQPFDAASARTTGDAVPLMEQVDYRAGVAQSQFSVSMNGILVYTSGAGQEQSTQLTWFDRTGKPSGLVGNPNQYERIAISPDGSMLATDYNDSLGVSSIWIHDLARGTASRFTFGPASSQFPVWSPDGSKLAYWRPTVETFEKSVHGTSQEQILYKDPQNRTTIMNNWSSDGRYLLFGVFDPGKGYGLDAVPMLGDRKPFTYLAANSNNGERVKLSPDGAFVAYTSTESKSSEVYVENFPEHGGKWQVSTQGGDWPVWSRDGRELYYLSDDNKIMEVAVKTSGRDFEAGVPRPLFPLLGRYQFDIAKDGRFLIQVPQPHAAQSTSINVVVNWQSALKK